MKSCRLVGNYKRFGKTLCLHISGRRVIVASFLSPCILFNFLISLTFPSFPYTLYVLLSLVFLRFCDVGIVVTRSFPGLKWAVRGDDYPPSSSAEVKERVELYLGLRVMCHDELFQIFERCG